MNAKHLLLPLTFILALPALSHARPVSFTTELSPYKGNGAYVALYLTDSEGKYKQTLWIAGKKSKYYKHLADWARGSGMKPAEYDGMTGASVSSGTTLKLTLEVADALIDAGYQVHIDTAVEDKRDNRSEVVVPLTTDGAGKPTAGKGYVKSFTYSF
jgi:hypothetical protein